MPRVCSRSGRNLRRPEISFASVRAQAPRDIPSFSNARSCAANCSFSMSGKLSLVFAPCCRHAHRTFSFRANSPSKQRFKYQLIILKRRTLVPSYIFKEPTGDTPLPDSRRSRLSGAAAACPRPQNRSSCRCDPGYCRQRR